MRVCRAGVGGGIQEVSCVGKCVGVHGIYMYVCRASVYIEWYNCMCICGMYMCMWCICICMYAVCICVYGMYKCMWYAPVYVACI